MPSSHHTLASSLLNILSPLQFWNLGVQGGAGDISQEKQWSESVRLRKLPDLHLWFWDKVQLSREGSDLLPVLQFLTLLRCPAGHGSRHWRSEPGCREFWVVLQWSEADMFSSALADNLLRLSPRLIECLSLSPTLLFCLYEESKWVIFSKIQLYFRPCETPHALPRLVRLVGFGGLLE